MKRLFVVSLTLIASMLLSLVAVNPASAGNDKVRVFVQFAAGQKGNVENSLKGVGAEFHYAFDDLNTFAVSVPAQALAGLERNPNVVLIEEDSPRYPIGVTASAVESPNLFSITGGQVIPYGVDMVQARDVWDANRDGVVDGGAVTASNRKVCIIDSGFYTSQEDLQGVNVSGYNGNLAWDQDGNGHGTHVAGTIAAMNNALGVVGVTPGTVNIYVVRVFGNDGTWAYSSTLIDAAYKCRDAGANIISMSLGGSRSNNTEKNGFATLYNTNGILSIAAAGNAGTNANSYPASYDSVVSVAAIDANKVVADFSQYNSQVEVAAPGVGVLSTVPYLDSTSLTTDGVTYSAGHIEFSARGSASGALVDGGLCTATNAAWSGKVVLCQRGDISFYDKVRNVQLSGGAAAAIYNNVPGGFIGTLGDGNSSTIVGISLSQEDGQYLVANKLGQSAAVSSTYTAPASGYEYYDGTSMATPHVSAVAALVWSSNTTATNAEIRQVLQQTAQDLGAAGRDVYYGYGLVQAKAAIDALGGGGGTDPNELHVGNMTGTKSTKGKNWSATVTITALDQNNAAVSGVVVTGSWSGAKTGTASCTTGTNGACAVSTGNMSSGTSVTFTVTDLAKSGFTYNAAANTISSLTVTK
ncbi:MAG: S8 family serine peptidase [Anaerolineales bacterium]|jgi:subtilisin family serine protease|nr:S8 family serine peptidase [Anaerolineales bacterium]